MMKNLMNTKRLAGLGMFIVGCVLTVLIASNPAFAQEEVITTAAGRLFKLIARFVFIGAGFTLIWQAIQVIMDPDKGFEWKKLVWIAFALILMVTAGAIIDIFTDGGSSLSGVFTIS